MGLPRYPCGFVAVRGRPEMQQKYAHELQAGEHYASLDYVVSPDLNQQFLYAVEDFAIPYTWESTAAARSCTRSFCCT